MAKPRKSAAKDLEAELAAQLKGLGLLSYFVRGYAFAPERPTWIYSKPKGQKWGWRRTKKRRGWEADFCCISARLLIECDGSTFHAGGHSAGAALENQYLRQAEANRQGFEMLRVTRRMIEESVAIDLITDALLRRLPNGKH